MRANLGKASWLLFTMGALGLDADAQAQSTNTPPGQISPGTAPVSPYGMVALPAAGDANPPPPARPSLRRTTLTTAGQDAATPAKADAAPSSPAKPTTPAKTVGRSAPAPVLPPPTPPAGSYFATGPQPAPSAQPAAAQTKITVKPTVPPAATPVKTTMTPPPARLPTKPVAAPVAQPVVHTSVIPLAADSPSPMIVQLMQSRQRMYSHSQLTGPDDHARVMEMRVMLAWLADPVTCRYPLRATGSGAMLQVSGTVPNSHIRAYVLNMAEHVSKLNVTDALRVQAGATPPVPVVPAEQLHHDVEAALARGPQRFIRDLHIQTHANGQVTVTGTVPSLEHKLTVSQHLRGVPGCNGIDNQLSVRYFLYEGNPYTLVSADGRNIMMGTVSVPAPQVAAVETVQAPPPPKPVAKVTPTDADRAKLITASPRTPPVTAATPKPITNTPNTPALGQTASNIQSKDARPTTASAVKPALTTPSTSTAKATTNSPAPSTAATAAVKKPAATVAEAPKTTGVQTATRVQNSPPAPNKAPEKTVAPAIPAKNAPSTATAAAPKTVAPQSAKTPATTTAATATPKLTTTNTASAPQTVASTGAKTNAPSKVVVKDTAPKDRTAPAPTVAPVPAKGATVVAAANAPPAKIIPVRAETVVKAPMIFQEKLPMPSRGPVSAGVVVLAGADETAQAEVASATLEGWLKQRVAMTCGPDGRNLEVALRSSNHMTVDLQTRDSALAQQLSRKILAMQELEPYRVTLKIQVDQ